MSNFPFDKQIMAMFIFITLFCVMSLTFDDNRIQVCKKCRCEDCEKPRPDVEIIQ